MAALNTLRLNRLSHYITLSFEIIKFYIHRTVSVLDYLWFTAHTNSEKTNCTGLLVVPQALFDILLNCMVIHVIKLERLLSFFIIFYQGNTLSVTNTRKNNIRQAYDLFSGLVTSVITPILVCPYLNISLLK